MAAFGSWLFARREGGEWLLRIEDLDPPREVAGATDLQMGALAAFGLHHDGAVVQQSQRGAVYGAALDRLLRDGAAFECHCSRSDLQATGGIHRRCVAGALRPDPAIRLRVPEGCEIAFDDRVHGACRQRVDVAVGDFVLRRADGPWAYQLAVVVDDAEQAVSEVVRGADLLDSTPRQILLQQALGLPTPTYAHLPLLMDDDGRKLSKSGAALAVDPREPLPTLAALWGVLGQGRLPHAASENVDAFLAAAADAFDPAAVPRSPVRASAALHNIAATSDD